MAFRGRLHRPDRIYSPVAPELREQLRHLE